MEACSEHFGCSGCLTSTPYRVSDGFLKCSDAPQATLGGSWSLQNHNSSALSVSQSPQEAPRSTPIHDPSALSTFQSLSSQHPSALPRLFEALGATKITIGSVGVPEPPGSPSKHPKSRFILVDVSEPQGTQNSNSGGPGAILYTFIIFETSQGVTSPIDPASAHLVAGDFGPARQASKAA